jgi:hypothetical protein
MAANNIGELLNRINDAEDAASKASTTLQRTREELVRRFAPVQPGGVEEWEVDGESRKVRVTNVQVAVSGRHGHKFVATADVLTNDGVETTQRVTCEWDIDENMAENQASVKSAGKGAGKVVAAAAAKKPAGGRNARK